MKFIFAVLLLFVCTIVFSQDTIIKKNSDVIKCKITEIGIEEVKFKTFGSPDSPVIILQKSEIKTVKVGGQTIIDVKEDTENANEDVITKKNGDVLKVKVIEIGTNEVKFKLYNDLYGPTISIEKSEIKTMKVGEQTVIDVKTGLKEDVIVKKDGSSLKVKVSELETDNVKFKLYNNPDGPTMSLKKSEIKTVIVDGQVVYEYKEDPRSTSNKAILNKTSSLKFHFFSPLKHHIAFSYEWMLNPGFNWECGIGIIGPGVSAIDNITGRNPSGAFLRVGPKFLLGSSSDVEIEGAVYSHPLKGRYFKIEMILNAMNVKYTDSYSYYGSGPIVYSKKYQSMVFDIIYGRQFILGNTITIAYYLGMGYGFESVTTIGNISNNFDLDPIRHSHWYFGKNFPLTFTSGFTIGYIIKAPEFLSSKRNKLPSRHSMNEESHLYTK
ncbi:MAG: hypothetical protein V1781_03740 [Bacteroidota bacterium]